MAKTTTTKKETRGGFSRGGKRPGAGAKQKYGEPTVNLVIRVPVSKKAKIKKMVQAELKKWLVATMLQK